MMIVKHMARRDETGPLNLFEIGHTCQEVI